jgi:hypothetical protein
LGVETREVGLTGSATTVLDLTRLPSKTAGVLITDTAGDSASRVVDILVDRSAL